MGPLAGYVSNGSNNVFLGSSAGFLSSGTSSGNIFIGYSSGYGESGSNKLYIENSSSSTPLVYGDFSTDNITINGSFNVTANTGLGVASPTERLEVAGTARLNSVSQDNSLNRVLVADNTGKIFWRDALNLTGATDNLGNHIATQSIIASSAGTYDIGSSTNYFRSIYFGDKLYLHNNAIFKATDIGTSDISTYIGLESGLSATGKWNCGYGYRTLYSNTTGFSNLAIGYKALAANTTGNSNAAFGYQCLYNNTSGGQNTAIGENAMSLNTTGSGNTAFGNGALGTNTTGTSNTALGYNANVGSGNLQYATAIGSNATVNVNYGLVLGISTSTVVGIRQNSPTHPLHVLNAYCDGTNWVNASDRDLKGNFRSIANDNILDKVMSLKIERWAYKYDTLKIDHIGPTAQDFHTAFKVGRDDKSISTVDEGGVALAAIQELNLKSQLLEKTIENQQLKIEKLETLVAQLSSTKHDSDADGIELFQNTPNPFSLGTEIRMNLPENAARVSLFIYNLEGKQLTALNVTERGGQAKVRIEAKQLAAGMYIYTLVVDNKVIDSKRMILTD
jgi:hypothetical protein